MVSRKKRLKKSALAILMALCMLCGTIQTSSVVYATEGVDSPVVEEITDDSEEEAVEEDTDESEEEGEETQEEGSVEAENAEEAQKEEEPTETEPTGETQEEESTEGEEVEEAQQEEEAAETSEDESETVINLEYVQGLINSLPDADSITEENASEVEALLDEIDEVKLSLTADELDNGLDYTRYDAACAALEVLAGGVASTPQTLAEDDSVDIDMSKDVKLYIDGTLYNTYDTIQEAVDYLKSLISYEVTDQSEYTTGNFAYTGANITYGYKYAEISFEGEYKENVDVTKSFTDGKWKVSTASSCNYVVPVSNITFNGNGTGVLNGKFTINGDNLTFKGIHFVGNYNQKFSYYSTDCAIVIKGDAGLSNSNRIVAQSTIDAGSAYVSQAGDYRNTVYTNSNIVLEGNEFEGYSFISNLGVSGGTVSSLYFDSNYVHDCMFVFHTSDAEKVTLSVTNNVLEGTAEATLATCVAATTLTAFSGNKLIYAGFGLQNCETDMEQFLNQNTYDHGFIYQETVNYSWTNEVLGTGTYYYLPSSTTVMTVLPEGSIAVWTSDYDTAGEMVEALTYTQQDAVNDGCVAAEDKTYAEITWTGGGTDENGNVLDGGVAIGYNYTAMHLDYVDAGSLTVGKNIVYGNSSKEFTFTVEIDTSTCSTSAVIGGVYGMVVDADGNEGDKVEFTVDTNDTKKSTATFTLSDGESVTFNNLPAGATYTVTEASTANYTATIEATDEDAGIDGNSVTGTVLSDGTTVSYTNTFSHSSGWETSKSKEATNLDENYESIVTLSLPSAEEQLVTDVVLVLDKSTSPELEKETEELLANLKAQIEETNAVVKVGVIIFNKVANVANNGEFFDLATEYDAICDAVETTVESGTNMNAGLLAAKEMLDGDTEVDDSRKYMILVSDGLSYLFCEDGDYGTAKTIASLNGGNDGKGTSGGCTVHTALDNWEIKYGSSNYTPENWDKWISDVESLLSTDYSQYVYEYGSSSIPTEKDSLGAVQYADRSSYPINADLSLYNSYMLYQELSASYHCYAVDNGNSAYSWGSSFMSYLAGGETVDFSEIQNDILYLLDAGSTVVDVIGYGTDNAENDYEFDFVDDASKLTLTVGDTIYTTSESTETLDTYETSRYTFTADGVTATNGAEAPFVLHYYKNGTDGASDECFVWDINVPISNFAKVQLSYSVVLTNPQETDGTYGTYDQYGASGGTELYTNVSATLYPVDSEGNTSAPEEFPKPTVSYEIVSLSGTKTWDDADDQDGKRPGSITVNLLADGEVIDTMTVTADDNDDWLFSFTNLRQWDDDDKGYDPITYTISENAVTDYSTTITYSDDKTVATITNSYTPGQTSVTVTKVWDDGNDQDQLRPDSVIITLVKNGTATEQTLTLSADNNWTGSFTALDMYTNGTENVYTIKEESVTGYTAVISDDASTGFVVTNSYQPETVEISVTKIWNDWNDLDELRPDSVTITLLKNGTATGQTLTLGTDNSWTGSFTALDKNTDGVENVYTIEEEEVTGYTAVISGDASTGFLIVNTHSVTPADPDEPDDTPTDEPETPSDPDEPDDTPADEPETPSDQEEPDDTPTDEPETPTDTTTETEDPGDTSTSESEITTDTADTQETVSTVAEEVVSAVTGDNAPIGLTILVAAVSEITLMVLIFLQMRKRRVMK